MMFSTDCWKGASNCKSCLDTGVFSPKPAKSVSCELWTWQSPSPPRNVPDWWEPNSSHVPALHQRGFSGVTCQCSASQRKKQNLHVLRHSCHPLQMGGHRFWHWTSLMLTWLGSCPAWHRCPWSPSLWVWMPQPSEKHWLPLAAWILGQENPATLHEVVVQIQLGFERNGAHWWQPAWAQVSSMHPRAMAYFKFWWAAISHCNTQRSFIILPFMNVSQIANQPHAHCHWPPKGQSMDSV